MIINIELTDNISYTCIIKAYNIQVLSCIRVMCLAYKCNDSNIQQLLQVVTIYFLYNPTLFFFANKALRHAKIGMKILLVVASWPDARVTC